MTNSTVYYTDRSYPLGELQIDDRGEFIRIEYSPDGYNVEDIYVPKSKLKELFSD